jgi:hypothetical protein
MPIAKPTSTRPVWFSRNSIRDAMMSTLPLVVIASVSEAIPKGWKILDCFVAYAPRNDDRVVL